MSEIVIRTNNVPRPIIEAHELTPAERKEEDWLDWAAIDEGADSASFVRYKGRLYPLSDFSADYGITKGTGLPSEYKGWHGYLSDSFFSGVLIRIVDDERVVMGWYYVKG